MKVFWFFFSKKNKPFFREQSRASAPHGKKQKTSSICAGATAATMPID
jgi:hypothetical protein